MAAHPGSIRRVALAAVAVLALSGLAACGDDDDEPSGGTTTTAPSDDGGSSDDSYGKSGDDGGSESDEDAVVAKDLAFTAPDSVPAGSTVEFYNEDGTTHTLTADDDSFDSGEVAGGSEGEITAPDEAGDHPFHCEIHSSMTGTLVVE